MTFLMSDIEESTRLWSAFPEAMGTAVGDLYGVLDRAISKHGGVRPVEQGEGDSVVGAFSRASDAVAAAVQTQRGLESHPWPEGLRLRVRIALHTADAQLRDQGNYFGTALSRCARLRGIAPGGLTLLSRATRDLVVDHLPEDVELVDCGAHRLRDLGRPEHVFALAPADAEVELEALRTLDSFPNNLPDQLTSFVGRGRELEQLREALTETRLLTLTGAGGVGKTRLALQLAADQLERFSDGVWWVDLAPLSDPALVDEALAAALGVRPLPRMSALDASCAQLSGSRALVVLDNCEHLLTASGTVAETLLRACPEVAVVTTSRTPLGVTGETDWRVPSLSLPLEEPERESVQALGQFDAVRLFIERARKARPNFAVTNDNAPALAQVCQELDGLPLAIELAAARVRMMSVEQIATGVSDRFHLLTGGARTALPRHQTLRACVDWSHELLSENERSLLRRLAVFAGGFTLDLAEEVCADQQLARLAILDLLTALVDKSLVVTEERVAVVRYRLLETVRQYALERLIEAGEQDVVRDRHRDVLLAFAERTAPELHGPDQRDWLAVLDEEAANLTGALERAAEADAERALRMCAALTFWWRARGRFVPAERGFSRSLNGAASESSALRARALWGHGYLAAYAGRMDVALAALKQACVMAEDVGDDSTLARALMMLGWIEMFSDPLGSRPINQRARELARASGDDWAFITSTINLAYAHLFRLEHDEMDRLLDEALPLSEKRGYLELQAWHWLAKCSRPLMAADAERVSELTERAVTAARAAGEPSTEALAECYRAWLELARGDAQRAVERLKPIRARMIAAGAGLALGYTECYLAPARAALGDAAEARSALERSVQGGLDGGWTLANTTVNLADILRIAGEPALAQTRAAQALEIAERIAAPSVIASCKESLGRCAVARGDWGTAEALLHESLRIRLEHDILMHLPQTFDALADVAAGLESHEEAAQILGAAQHARTELSLARSAPDQPHYTQLEKAIREALGADADERRHAEGQQLSAREAATWIGRARGDRKRPARGWESLTSTELRVVQFVAQGLTNPDIGKRMFISRGTVKVHLSHIFAKLGIATRAELAAEATRRALVP
ncbi:MAG TPA: LuxR C-terminal-related transcriptional regulator [Solirubrobacteraceae bacterium]|nr:LuxR C-terminal-related transcriptional regulator [Solirubrobacteraceae bacterium]